MTFLCNIFVLTCQLLELSAKMVLFLFTCNGRLTKALQNTCQGVCRRWTRVVQYGCCFGCEGCSRKFTVRSGLKVLVRTFHGVLTVLITSSLLYYKTGLRSAVDNYDFNYCTFFFGTLIVSVVTYYVSCFVNPGYIPIPIRSRHNTFDSDEDEPLEIGEATKMIIENTRLRKCGFCGVMQPLRARHCEDCNQCVRRFDHHCPWLETCIGEHNHRYFLIFVISKAVLTIWATVIICQALEFHEAWGTWLRSNVVLLIDLCVTVTASVTLTVLAALHTYLMATNTTTWEMVSRHRISYLKNLDEDLNPFHQGYCSNIYSFLCSQAHQRWDDIYQANTPEASV